LLIVSDLWSYAIWPLLQVRLTDGRVTQMDVGHSWSDPWGIAINAANSVLYVSDSGDDHIYSVDLATQVVTRLDSLTSTFSDPRAITLDASQTVLYISEIVSAHRPSLSRRHPAGHSTAMRFLAVRSFLLLFLHSVLLPTPLLLCVVRAATVCHTCRSRPA